MTSTLVVAALEAEVRAFKFPVCVTGPGKIQAATNLALTVSLTKPDRILVAGTAAALHDAMQPGVYTIGKVIQWDYTPLRPLVKATVDPKHKFELGAPGPTIATGDSFVADERDRSRLAESADLVDMEAYAYAYVADLLSIPITILKAVSDAADAAAAKSWQDTVALCSSQLWERVQDFL